MKKLMIMFAMFPTVAMALDLGKLGEDMSGLADKVPAEGVVIVGLAAALEFILRYIPSEKPLSIAHGLSAMLKGLASLSKKVADLMDKILPQKLAPQPSPQPPAEPQP